MKREDKQYRKSLELKKTNDLIDIIIDQEERLSMYEEKERENTKQGKA